MADMGNSAWSETDASNNTTPPDGWPEGMNPSDVNNSARANMGGLKRWWDRSNVTLTTGGTTTAYTLTYSVAAAAYYNGETFACVINATCGASPTLNINSLGACNIRKFAGGAWANLAAGDIQANEVLEVYYNSGAGTFDIVAQPPVSVWQVIDSQLLSGASNYNKQSISTSINHLRVILDLTVGTNAASLEMQYYNTSGVLDTGGSSYYYAYRTLGTDSSASITTATTSFILLANSISSSTNIGCSGTIDIQNIQAAKYTQANFSANWLDSAGVVANSSVGYGVRNAAGNITGIKIFPSSGTISGKVTLLGTAN